MDPTAAAAGAGPLPGHLRQQPRRVLHGPGRRPQAPHRHRPGRALAPRASSRARCSSRSPWSRHELMARHAAVFKDDVRPALAEEGITIVRWDELRRGRAGAAAASMFREPVFPVLTPLAVDPAHPFPYISGLSLNLAVVAGQPQDRQRALRPGQGAAAAAPLHRGRATRPRDSPDGRPLQARGSSRSRTSSPRTWTSSSPAWRCASTSPSGSPATRTSRSRRTTPRTSSPPWRRS